MVRTGALRPLTGAQAPLHHFWQPTAGAALEMCWGSSCPSLLPFLSVLSIVLEPVCAEASLHHAAGASGAPGMRLLAGWHLLCIAFAAMCIMGLLPASGAARGVVLRTPIPTLEKATHNCESTWLETHNCNDLASTM